MSRPSIKVVCPSCEFYSVYNILFKTDFVLTLQCICCQFIFEVREVRKLLPKGGSHEKA